MIAGERGDRVRAGAARLHATGCRRSPSTARRSCARPRWRRSPRSPSPRRATRSRTSSAGSLLEELRAGRRRRLGGRAPRRAARLRPRARGGRPGRRGALVAPAPRGRADLERSAPSGCDSAELRRAAADLRDPAGARRRRRARAHPAAARALAAPAPRRTGRPPSRPSTRPRRAGPGGRRGGADARGGRRATSAWPSSSTRGSATASTACCSARWPPTPRRCGASTRTRSRRSSRHDHQYRTDLLGTLEAYLANDCNMNATARGHLRAPPHGRLPARAREGADRPRPEPRRGPRAPGPGHQGVPDHRADPAALDRRPPAAAAGLHPPLLHALLEALDHRLDDLHSRVALRVSPRSGSTERTAGRCGRACPRPHPRTRAASRGCASPRRSASRSSADRSPVA